jgi:hypothetical protein
MPDALAELVRDLTIGRQLYVRIARRARAEVSPKRLASIRRRFALNALNSVLRFITASQTSERHPEISNLKLDVPLRDLANALEEIEAGRAPDMFRPGSKKSALRVESTFKGQIAAMAEVLHRGGVTRQQAYEAIATRCTRQGYTTPRGNCEITWKTVRGWRKEAREGAQNNDLRDAHDFTVSILAEHGLAEHGVAQSETGNRFINGMVADLSDYQPPKGLGPLALNVDEQEK